MRAILPSRLRATAAAVVIAAVAVAGCASAQDDAGADAQTVGVSDAVRTVASDGCPSPADAFRALGPPPRIPNTRLLITFDFELPDPGFDPVGEATGEIQEFLQRRVTSPFGFRSDGYERVAGTWGVFDGGLDRDPFGLRELDCGVEAYREPVTIVPLGYLSNGGARDVGWVDIHRRGDARFVIEVHVDRRARITRPGREFETDRSRISPAAKSGWFIHGCDDDPPTLLPARELEPCDF